MTKDEMLALRERLGPTALQTIYARYLEPDIRAAQVIAEFDLPIHPSELLRLIPETVRVDKPCQHCQTPMHQRVRKKTQKLDNCYVCPACGHREADKTTLSLNDSYRVPAHCRCSSCLSEQHLKEQQQYEEHKRRALEWAYEQLQKAIPYPYSKLTLREKVLLLGRLLTTYEDGLLPSITDLEPSNRLMPTEHACEMVDRMMYLADILSVSPLSPAAAFEPDLFHINICHAYWIVNVCDERGEVIENTELIQMLSNELREHPIGIDRVYQGLLEEIAVEEAMRALEHLMRKVRLRLDAPEKVRRALAELASDHSLEELCYYASKAVESADKYWRGKTKNGQLSATIPKGIRRVAEFARRGNWIIPTWTPEANQSPCFLSALLFDRIFGGAVSHMALTDSPAKIIAMLWHGVNPVPR